MAWFLHAKSQVWNFCIASNHGIDETHLSRRTPNPREERPNVPLLPKHWIILVSTRQQISHQVQDFFLIELLQKILRHQRDR